MHLPNWSFPGRYGPEWGSGGIFGLKYHNGVLYFTLAFEAESHFIELKSGDENVYSFTMIGQAPRSGGDTYNAVETVDEFIYFGGWVHAPARYLKGRISFVNKYSHVHVYDTENQEVKLIWKDSIHQTTQWAGEVGDILYDPYNDRLLLAREDGHANLGVYSLDRHSGKTKRLLEEPSPKGTLVHDVAVFGIGSNFSGGVEEFGVLDLETHKWEFLKPGKSLDSRPVERPELGCMASAYNRVFAFVRGGFFVGSPFLEEEFTFYRLFDFPTFYAPFRVNALNVGGGILTAYNSYHDVSFENVRWGKFTHLVAGPSVLLYIIPPMVKIVGTFGARVTSIEKVGGKLLIATNNASNTGATEATPFDTGNRDIVLLDEKILEEKPPVVSFSSPLPNGRPFGGIPLDGYRRPRIIFYLKGDNRLTVYEYDVSTSPLEPSVEHIELVEGKNVIPLDSFSGIVSFELEKSDSEGKFKIDLR
ncbi:DUF2139 domain-containing protein [Thermococcus sp.]|uniref:DUF2139 domain-containing protein n=1 Tax=Thermococcus sp. TaxID=35749 RepID=UPI00260F8ADC|nr:DUF2139 domain-containing protein [Thermococcus sp.]